MNVMDNGSALWANSTLAPDTWVRRDGGACYKPRSCCRVRAVSTGGAT